MKPKQEIKVVAQIIQELALFLMYHGYKTYALSFNDDDLFETFHLELPHMNHNLIEQMKQQIEQPREESIEAYYFELLGDLDTKEDLELLGIFIDTMEVKETESSVLITLKRKK
jgi:hypothetical protein